MSSLWSKPKIAPVLASPMPPPAKSEDAALSNAAALAKLRRRMAYGQSDTMLTSDLGAAPTRAKTLLGE
jgi:hypothetical protein